MSNRITGAWDVHVHAAPSLFDRWGDGWDLGLACRAAGMAGVVLKAHHGSTVETARLLDRQLDDLTVLGGIVLNQFVGGVQPLVVEQCIALGGRFVWLPTIHAAHHGAVLGSLGAFSFQGRPLAHTPATGVSILDEDGALTEATREVLALLDRTDVVLGTGHVSTREIVALRQAIDADARRIRLLVNHSFFTVPALTLTELEELAGPDVFFEVCDLSASAITHATTPAHVARHLSALPDAQWVLASDSGQRENVTSPAALARFAAALSAEGVDRRLLERMLRAHPARLLR